MGLERYVGTNFAGGLNPAIQQAEQAIITAASNGGSEQVCEFVFDRLGDQSRLALAYLYFVEKVQQQVPVMAARYAEAAREQQAARDAAERLAAEEVVTEAREREAVPGHPGIYRKTHADGTISYAAKWPNPNKPRAALTQSGFASIEEAEEFRNDKLKERVAA